MFKYIVDNTTSHSQILNKMMVFDFFLNNLIFCVCLAVGYVGILQYYELSLRTIGFMEREIVIIYPMYIAPVYFVFILLNSLHYLQLCVDVMCNATKQKVNEHFRFQLNSKLYHHRCNVIIKLKKPI
ncbi:unnamed protein product [Aphis gossypii]|uniref:Uncharacterized protein n=1 Tax=Aphis gossypii TaxID=80765 RepID=A0A9P0IQS6_APHGO|nr:unnamed protein product [Aphis gossypii]